MDIFGPGVENIWVKKTRRRRKLKSVTGTVSPEVKSQLGEAELCFVNGDNIRAAEILSDVSRKHPTLAEPYNIMALMYEDTGDVPKALQLYTLVATLLPSSVDTWGKVASLAEACGNFKHALLALDHCIKAERSPEHYIAKISIYLNQRQARDAKEALRKFLKIFPDEIGYLIEFGDIALELKLKRLAIHAYVQFAFHFLGGESGQLLVSPSVVKLYTGRPVNLQRSLTEIEENLGLIFHAVNKAADLLLEQDVRSNFDSKSNLNVAASLLQLCMEVVEQLRARYSHAGSHELPTDIAILYGLSKLRLDGRFNIEKGLQILGPILDTFQREYKLSLWNYFNSAATVSGVTSNDVSKYLEGAEPYSAIFSNALGGDASGMMGATAADGCTGTGTDTDTQQDPVLSQSSTLNLNAVSMEALQMDHLSAIIEFSNPEELEIRFFYLRQQVRIAEQLSRIYDQGILTDTAGIEARISGVGIAAEQLLTQSAVSLYVDAQLQINRPDMPPADALARLWCGAGHALQSLHKYGPAFEAFQNSLALSSVANPESLLMLARIAREHLSPNVMVREAAVQQLGEHFFMLIEEFEQLRQLNLNAIQAPKNENGDEEQISSSAKPSVGDLSRSCEQSGNDTAVDPVRSGPSSMPSVKTIKDLSGTAYFEQMDVIKARIRNANTQKRSTVPAHSTDLVSEVPLENSAVKEDTVRYGPKVDVANLEKVMESLISNSNNDESGSSSSGATESTVVGDGVAAASGVPSRLSEVGATSQQYGDNDEEDDMLDWDDGGDSIADCRKMRFSRASLAAELRCLVEWGLALYTRSDERSFCAIVVPLLDMWSKPQSFLNTYGKFNTRRSRKLNTIFLSDITNAHCVRYFPLNGLSWLDTAQNACYRLMLGICEFFIVDGILGSELLLHIAELVNKALQSLQSTTTAAAPTTTYTSSFSSSSTSTGDTHDMQIAIDREELWRACLATYRPLGFKSGARKGKRRIGRRKNSGDGENGSDQSDGDDGDYSTSDDSGEYTEDEHDEVEPGVKKTKRRIAKSRGKRLGSHYYDNLFVTECRCLSQKASKAAIALLANPNSIRATNDLFHETVHNGHADGLGTSVEERLPSSRFLLGPSHQGLGLNLLNANGHALRGSALDAIRGYLSAFCRDTNQPLIALCTGAYLVTLADAGVSKNKYHVLLKGWAFIHHYINLRRKHMQHARSAVDTHTPNDTVHTSAPIVEEELDGESPAAVVMYQETLYNLGRMFQGSNLKHLAVEQYTAALNLATKFPSILADNAAGNDAKSGTGLHVTRECAHNLVLIYKASNSLDLALEVLMKYLTV